MLYMDVKEEDLQTLENIIRGALALVAVNEPEEAIQDLTQALKIIWGYL